MPTHIRIVPGLDADVIVAGAGPAGCAAAIHLARAGIRVLILEYAQFPRDKICGDFIGPVGLMELKKLGLNSTPAYKNSPVIRQAGVYLDGELLIRRNFPEIDCLPAHGRVIPRKQLDHLIFEKALACGVKAITGARVKHYRINDGSVEIDYLRKNRLHSLRAKILIGADGSTSTIARILRGHSAPSKNRIIAVRGYFQGVADHPRQAELFFSSATFPGYYWYFPIGNRMANVGIGMLSETVPRGRANLRELLLKLINEDPALNRLMQNAELYGSIKAWPLSTYNPCLPTFSDRVILAGDAAGLINPLNGEGIQYALLSGRWASGTVQRCFTENDFSPSALAGYGRKIERELRYDMALSQMIVQLIRNRDLNPLWLTGLRAITQRARRDGEYARIAGGILAGMVPAGQVLSARMLGGTLLSGAGEFMINWLVKCIKQRDGIGSASLFASAPAARACVNMAAKPVRTLLWTGGVTAGAVELGSQILQNVIGAACAGGGQTGFNQASLASPEKKSGEIVKPGPGGSSRHSSVRLTINAEIDQQPLALAAEKFKTPDPAG